MLVNPSNRQHPIVAEMVSALDEIQHEHYEERAAILQYSADLDRPFAEAVALLEIVCLYGWPPRHK